MLSDVKTAFTFTPTLTGCGRLTRGNRSSTVFCCFVRSSLTGGTCRVIAGSLPSRGLLSSGASNSSHVLLQCYFRDCWWVELIIAIVRSLCCEGISWQSRVARRAFRDKITQWGHSVTRSPSVVSSLPWNKSWWRTFLFLRRGYLTSHNAVTDKDSNLNNDRLHICSTWAYKLQVRLLKSAYDRSDPSGWSLSRILQHD